MRVTQSGLAVTNLRVAVSERRRDGGGDWREYTDWITVVCFGRTAENVGDHVKKGKQIYIEGRLQNRNFKNKDGSERWTTEVIADRIIFLGGSSSRRGGAQDLDFSDEMDSEEFD